MQLVLLESSSSSSSSKLCPIYVGVGYLNDMDWWDTSHGPADGPLSS